MKCPVTLLFDYSLHWLRLVFTKCNHSNSLLTVHPSRLVTRLRWLRCFGSNTPTLFTRRKHYCNFTLRPASRLWCI